jgi:hypothetical protein
LPSFSSVSNFVIGGDRAIALFDHCPFLAAFHGRAVRQKDSWLLGGCRKRLGWIERTRIAKS